jgi:hypothetical protein
MEIATCGQFLGLRAVLDKRFHNTVFRPVCLRHARPQLLRGFGDPGRELNRDLRRSPFSPRPYPLRTVAENQRKPCDVQSIQILLAINEDM